MLQQGAKAHTKIEQCQALEELPAIQKSRPSWNRRKLDFYADTMQPFEASLVQGNYGYKLLLGSQAPPPVTAPLSSFISSTQETTLRRAWALSTGVVESGAPFLPPSETELDQAVESATAWRDKFIARVVRDNGKREMSNFLQRGDPTNPALDTFLPEEDRKVALPYVEYFTQVRDDLTAYKAPSTWDELLPLLTSPPYEVVSSRRNIDENSNSYYHREMLKYRERRQLLASAITFRTYGTDTNSNRENTLPRHLTQRAQELFDAAEQGDDKMLRQLTLPSKAPLTEELLPIAIFAEEPMLEYDRCKMSPLQVALDAGKWETVCTIMDICAKQYQPSDKKSKYSLQVGYNYGSDSDGEMRRMAKSCSLH